MRGLLFALGSRFRGKGFSGAVGFDNFLEPVRPEAFFIPAKEIVKDIADGKRLRFSLGRAQAPPPRSAARDKKTEKPKPKPKPVTEKLRQAWAFAIGALRRRTSRPLIFLYAADTPRLERGAVARHDPYALWAETLREAKIPARVSYHAGTYLCNATLYWSHYLAEKLGLTTRTTFVHLPLDVSQVAQGSKDTASLPAETSAQALRLMLGELHAGDAPTTGERPV